ncbi:MAG: tRNA pseudouridine(55) synthase TruB [Fimbriimonadales bacterium]|nr:tRNA pseudouridine(55) synthase TruB [Fimbriimonadales bacterium]
MDGVLNLNKPTGITSHDVVERIRATIRQREVGHTGTLDPMADGVLVLCLGRATRLTPYLQSLPKKYRGIIQFGIRTTTQDIEGEIFSQIPAPHLTLEQVQAVAQEFIGRIQQIPPMYSAVKIEGKRLYELAREGKEVERPPRTVTIYALQIEEWQPGEFPTARFYLECSAGTYVRTLASDIGDRLGVGAHLKQLTRLAVGHFRLEEAQPLEIFTDPESVAAHLIAPADALPHLPRWKPTAPYLERLLNGNFVQVEHPLWTPGGYVLVMEDDQRIALIARWLPPLLRPVRVIHA